jgi:hypothetical protein
LKLIGDNIRFFKEKADNIINKIGTCVNRDPENGNFFSLKDFLDNEETGIGKSIIQDYPIF